MRALILVALLMSAVPAFADDALTPTEGGEHTDSGPADKPDTGCHRCVQGPDGGYSDSDYSNPEGNYYTSTGDLTCCAPGLSQDWAWGTGHWYDPGTYHHSSNAVGANQANSRKDPGNDHSKTRE